MSQPLESAPILGAFPPHVMEPLHAELAITYLGALEELQAVL